MRIVQKIASKLRKAAGILIVGSLVLTGCNQSPTVITPAATPLPGAQIQADWIAKITTGKPGFYRIDGVDLFNSGILSTLSGGSPVFLYNRGRPVPVWIVQNGKRISYVFYAVPVESIYTEQNTYWLAGSPLPPAVTRGDEPKTPEVERVEGQQDLRLPQGAYLDELHAEINKFYQPQVVVGDHWFWANLPAPQAQEFVIPLRQVSAGGTAYLQVRIWSSTEAPAEPDHHIVVSINNIVVADETWDGGGEHIIDAKVDTAHLKDGENTIRLQLPGDLGVAAEIDYLDWIRIQYPRIPEAVDGYLEFIQPDAALSLENFSSPVSIYDISNPDQPGPVELDHKPGKPFKGVPGNTYAAVGEGGYLEPVAISSPQFIPDLRLTSPGAEYLAVGPQALLDGLRPLLDLRAQQSMRTLAIPVDAIYDQFNDGVPEPQAINNFIRFASQNWTVLPRYVLLVGDASYDPKGFVAPPEANQLPTFLVETVFGGETASDVGFVQLNEDPWPDLAIGRVPARSVEQVEIFVK